MWQRLMAVGAIVVAGVLGACTAEPIGLPTSDAGPTNQAKGNQQSVVQISLVGSATFPRASGKAKFDDRGARRELQIEAEDLQALAGTSVNFFLGGINIGSATVSALGDARLTLRTQLGQSVPVSVAGQSVEIETPGETVVVSGSF